MDDFDNFNFGDDFDSDFDELSSSQSRNLRSRGNPSSSNDFGGSGSSGLIDDDFDDFGSNSSTSDGFDSPLTTSNSKDKSSVIKQSAIIASVGICIIILAFFLVSKVSNNKADQGDKKQQVSVNNSQVNNAGSDMQNTQTSNQSTVGSWKRFDSESGLRFNSEYLDATFTITGISHYVKIVDAAGNFEVKTELTGSISGLTGTYTVDVPYYKGCQLSKLDKFTVRVQLGEYNGKVVVGEIKY